MELVSNTGSIGGSITNSGASANIGNITLNGQSKISGDINNAGGIINGSITLAQGSSITGSLTNSGTIQNKVEIAGTLGKGINNSGGIINGSVTIAEGGSITSGGITNSGTISGNLVVSSGANVSDGITNSGKISGDINNAGGIINGSITLAQGSSITGSLTNSGTIQNKVEIAGTLGNGINNSGGIINGSVTIAEGGSITSGGITNSGTINQGITLAQGSSITGDINNSGGIINQSLKIESGANVAGNINNTGGTIQEKVEIAGTLSGDFINGGTIGQSLVVANTGSITGKIENKKGANIAGGIQNEGNANLTISNQGILQKGIENQGNGKVTLNNEGSIGANDKGKHLTNAGNGSIEVKNWLVQGDSSSESPERIVVEDKNQGVKFENITLDTSLKLENITKLDDIVTGVDGDNVSKITHKDTDITISIKPKLDNPLESNDDSNVLQMRFSQNANKVGRTVTKALSVSADKRANFAETTMNNSLKGLSHSLKQQMRATIGSNSLDRDAMYASAGLNDFTTSFDLPNPRTSAAFMLPYYTKHSSQMQKGWNDATGDTKGIVVGYTRLIGEDFLGVYAGSDKMKLDASNPKDNNAMALENNTYYGGIKYAVSFKR